MHNLYSLLVQFVFMQLLAQSGSANRGPFRTFWTQIKINSTSDSSGRKPDFAMMSEFSQSRCRIRFSSTLLASESRDAASPPLLPAAVHHFAEAQTSNRRRRSACGSFLTSPCLVSRWCSRDSLITRPEATSGSTTST